MTGLVQGDKTSALVRQVAGILLYLLEPSIDHSHFVELQANKERSEIGYTFHDLCMLFFYFSDR